MPHDLSPSDPPLVEIAAAVIERGGRYLIARRPDHAVFGGYWEFPGGKRAAGETLDDCLRREVLEETGMRISSARLIQRTGYRYPHAVVDIHFYRCSVAAGDPRPSGVEIRWVSPDRLGDFRFPPANADLLRLLATGM